MFRFKLALFILIGTGLSGCSPQNSWAPVVSQIPDLVDLSAEESTQSNPETTTTGTPIPAPNSEPLPESQAGRPFTPLPGAPIAPGIPTPAPPAPRAEATLAGQVLLFTNAARSQGRYCGDQYFESAPPLKLNSTLNVSAQTHAEDMGARAYFNHESPEGTRAWNRAEALGYRYETMAENIAYGQRDAQAAVLGWVQSPGHCKNLMNPALTEMGAGIALGTAPTGQRTLYWVQVFGRP